jgi:malate dehydrogenase (quinone)
MRTRSYDVVIVGGGVSGTALAYVLTRYTNITSIALIEKYDRVAQVNSHPLNNAQTSHEGDTETNYSPEHALEVKDAATALRTYVEKRNAPGLFRKTSRMVLGVGEDECRTLRERFEKIHAHYPHLMLVEKPEELFRLEPMIMLDRDVRERVTALVSTEGYAINYQKLAECMLADARTSNRELDVFYNSTVTRVRRLSSGSKMLETSRGEIITAKVAVFAAGAFSLLFAQQLGFAKDLAILPVAGNFYDAGSKLNGKVYRVQVEGLPFAAIHGDPDVLDSRKTRLGPTTKPLPLLERHRYWTVFDFLRYPILTLRGIWTLIKLLSRRQLLGYVLKNLCYEIPLLGSWLFLKEARAIIPSLKWSEIKKRRGVGGIRPQIVDLKTGALELGDRTLVEGGCIFNTTPSPGASVCLANAQRDAKRVVDLLGDPYRYNCATARKDFGLKNKLTAIA